MGVDSLADRQKTFFGSCRKLKAADREEEFEKIREEYKKVVEDANEKVQISEECYSLVDRYLRKLDEELLKFKCELEADNRGITEILEKQSLEMDALPSSGSLGATGTSKENRQPKKHKKQNSMDFSLFPSMANDPSFGTSAATSFSPNFGPIPQAASPASTSGAAASTMSLQHIGVGGNAIAAAATQAIAATQQLSGRRSSSLKASYEAINLGVQANEFSIGRELAGAAQAAIASTSFETQHHQPEQQRKNKNKTQ